MNSLRAIFCTTETENFNMKGGDPGIISVGFITKVGYKFVPRGQNSGIYKGGRKKKEQWRQDDGLQGRQR